MGTTMPWSLALIALFFVGNMDATIDYQCWNFHSTNELREKYINNINRLRSEIANGRVEGKNGKCPAGKNVYRLFWDCLLEEEAQKVVDKCKDSAKAPDTLAMVIKKVPLDTCNPIPLFKKTVDGWWNVVKTQNVDPKYSYAKQRGAAEFCYRMSFFTVQLAYGAATRIGCAQRNCNGNLYMACMVYKKGPSPGEPIYEVGTGCTNNQQCETYAESRCDTNKKLCVAGYIDPTKTTTAPPATTPAITTTVGSGTTPSAPVTTPAQTTTPFPIINTKCPAAQARMSNDLIRDKFEKLHNQHRSTVARGGVMMGRFGASRPGSQIRKLYYACELEVSAYKSAQRCSDTDSGTAGVDEVRKTIRDTNIAFITAAEQASRDWYNEIHTGYMEQNASLGQRNMYTAKLGIPNFAKMVWESHTKIGCAVVRCTSFTNVVCHYTPQKFREGYQIYKMGGACNRCKFIPTTCSDYLCV